MPRLKLPDSRIILALSVISVLIAYSAGSAIADVSPSTTFTLSQWGGVESYDYVVFTDGTNIYAKNGETGAIDYSGTTSSTVISNAISNGNNILIKTGTYTITSTINILKSDVILKGEGDGTVLQVSGNISVLKVGDGTYDTGPGTQYENVVIKDLQIDLNGNGAATNDVYGIWIHTVDDYRIENIHIHNQATSTVRASAIAVDESDGGVIYNNHIHETINGIAVRHGSSYNTISDNHVHDVNNFDGITTFQSDGNNAIVGNVVHDNADNGILLDGDASGRNPDTTVTGNVSYNNNNEGIESFNSWRAVITGNAVNDNGRRGISLHAAGDGGFTVVGNEVHNNAGDGIYVFQSRFGTVTGNTIRENDGNGINIVSTNTNTDYAGNMIYFNGQNGIVINATGFATVVGNNLRDNGQETHNTYDEIALTDSAQQNIVSDNTIRINAATKARYGIAEHSSSDNNNLVTDNLIVGAATANGLINGASSIWRDNKGFVTENDGTGSITSGSTSDVITHNLDYTPSAAECSVIFTEDPTNTPGAMWIDTITSTQFTVNVEADPGASNLDFSWSCERI